MDVVMHEAPQPKLPRPPEAKVVQSKPS